MKKLFISCPMRGRTQENIKESMEQMHKIAEIVFDEELKVIDSIVTEEPPKDAHQAVWYLGLSLMKLAEADYFIGIGYSDFYSGCEIEARVAERYNIPSTFVNMDELMPDAVENVIGSTRELRKKRVLPGEG